jgi:hypothetical protein
MSGKVLATIAQALTLDGIDAMAERAEMDRASARKAAELGVPAILTALTELVARPSGVARLSHALAGRSASSAPGPDGRGDGITFLFGGEDAGALASAIGRVVGAPACSAHAFLDELTSTILGTLAREGQKPKAGGKGFADLLNAEKDLIAAAMPAGLSSLLCANTSSRRLGAEVSMIGSAGTARTPIPRLSTRAATASSARRRSLTSQAYWGVLLAALAALAWYVLAAKIEQTGGGGSDVVISTLPEPNARPQVLAHVADLNASAQFQGADVYNRAGKTIGAMTEVLWGPDGIAPALLSLARFFGFAEDGIVAPTAPLGRWQHDNGGDGRLILDTATADLRGRQLLHFVSPEFRDAIRPPVTAAVDTPVGPTIAAH